MELGHGRRLVSLVITSAIGVSFPASESVQASACTTDPRESGFEATHGDAAARVSLVQHRAHTVMQAYKNHPEASSRRPKEMSSSVAASVPPELASVATPGALMKLPEASPAWREALPFGVSSLSNWSGQTAISSSSLTLANTSQSVQNASAMPNLSNWSRQTTTSSSSLQLANRSPSMPDNTGNIWMEALLNAARREDGEVRPRRSSSRSGSNESHGKRASVPLNTRVMIVGFVLVLIGFCCSFVKFFKFIAAEPEIDGDVLRIGNSLSPQEKEDGHQNAEAWIPDTWYPFSKNPEMPGQKGLKRTDPDMAAEQAVLLEPRSLLPAEQSKRAGDGAYPTETTSGASSSADHARSREPESDFRLATSSSTSSIGVQACDDPKRRTENDPSDPPFLAMVAAKLDSLKNAGSAPTSETDGTHISIEDALEDVAHFSDERSCSSGTMRAVMASSASGSVREDRDTISRASSCDSTCDVGVSTDPLFVFLRVDQEDMGSALLTHRCDVKKLDELKLQHNAKKKERSEAVHELKELIGRQQAKIRLPPIQEEDRSNAVARTTKSKKELGSSPTAEEAEEV